MILNKYLISKLLIYKNSLIFGLLFLFIFSPNSLLNKLEFDDASYVSHALTIGLDFDLDYSNEPVDQLYANKKVPPHPIGSGILAAPFVSIFSIIDRFQNHPIINNHKNYYDSWSLFGIMFASSFYFLLGIILYIKSFQLLSLIKSNFMLIILLFSSTIPFFVLNRYFFSHSYEFFSISLLLWILIKIYLKKKNNDSIQIFILLYLVVLSLNMFVRYSNINLFLLPPLLFITIIIFIEKNNKEQKKLVRLGFLLSLLGFISLIPNSIFYYFNYGSLIPKPGLIYDKPYWFESQSIIEIIIIIIERIPFTLKILFSSELGLLYTNPTIAFGLICGIYLIIKNYKQKSTYNFLNTILLFLLICFFGWGFSLHLWWQGLGSSYGYRYLLQVLPIAVLFSLFLLKNANNYKDKFIFCLKPIIIIASFISLVSLGFFASTPKLKLSKKVNTFYVQKTFSGNGYMFDLVREIVKPYTWFRVIAKGPIGFLASPIVVKNNIGKNFIKDDFSLDVNKYYSRSKLLSTNIFIQILLMILFWVSFGYKLDFIKNKKI